MYCCFAKDQHWTSEQLSNGSDIVIAPAGISPRRRNPEEALARILRKVLTDDIYIHTVNIEKISISLKRGRKESVGNDDVSIVCARK